MADSPSSSLATSSSPSEREKLTPTHLTVVVYEDEFGVSSTTPPLPRLPKPHPLTPMVAALIAAKCEAEAKTDGI